MTYLTISDIENAVVDYEKIVDLIITESRVAYNEDKKHEFTICIPELKNVELKFLSQCLKFSKEIAASFFVSTVSVSIGYAFSFSIEEMEGFVNKNNVEKCAINFKASLKKYIATRYYYKNYHDKIQKEMELKRFDEIVKLSNNTIFPYYDKNISVIKDSPEELKEAIELNTSVKGPAWDNYNRIFCLREIKCLFISGLLNGKIVPIDLSGADFN